jgi:hypothetical protein
MTGTADLARYLVPQGESDLGFHQGVVVTWDSTTNENTILVGGVEIPDVPALSIGDSIMMSAGDVVGLLRFKSTYFVLGRITLPGVSNAFGVKSDQLDLIETMAVPSSSFGDLTTLGPKVTANIGSARRCLVFSSAGIDVTGIGLGQFGVQVSGVSNILPQTDGTLASSTNNGTLTIQTTMVREYTAADGLNQGVNTFTMKYRLGNSTDSVIFSSRNISVFPF